MELAQPLPTIKPDGKDGSMSSKQLQNTLNDDDTAYVDLAVRHNALVNHVKKFCQS